MCSGRHFLQQLREKWEIFMLTSFFNNTMAHHSFAPPPRPAHPPPGGSYYRNFHGLNVVYDPIFYGVISKQPTITPLNLSAEFGNTLYILQD
ncbi:hypothetical protein TNCV_4200721 [Trichonephila clavipes]|uniref:Uncharacterized protein n=1 Tax=Trichonephila clavipes TaxID=2585209 RepID=A0A8X6WB52_TRICX|nr:hypothetical protein TNCV_4200721 [Trichonephila clavipes]